MKLAGLCATLLCLWQASAQTFYTNPPIPYSSVSGPYDLGRAYPLTVYRGGKNTTANGNEQSTCNTNSGTFAPIVSNKDGKIMTGRFNVNVIYYGDSFTSRQKAVIENFVANIGASNYWNIVLKYTYGKATPGVPVLNRVIQVSPSAKFTGSQNTGILSTKNSNAPRNGHGANLLSVQDSLLQSDEVQIISALKVNGLLDYGDGGALNLIIGGTDVTYTFQTSSGKQYQLGSTDYCARHDYTDSMADAVYDFGISNKTVEAGYRMFYAYVGMPAKGSNCFVLPSILGPPNGDAALDNAINFILHEMVESVVAPPWGAQNIVAFSDQCGLQPMDKCSNIYTNLIYDATTKQDYNLVLNGTRYAVQPIWDIVQNRCATPA